MAKILGTVVALDRFRRINQGGLLYPAVPDNVEEHHLCDLGPEPWTWGWQSFIVNTTEPMFFEGRFADDVRTACGIRARTLLPKPFDSEHPKACSRCLAEVGLKGR